MKVRVEVVGEREVIQELQRMGAAGVDAAKRVLDAAMSKAKPMAVVQCPVDDIEAGPHMKDTIRVTKARATKSGFVSAGLVAGPVRGVRGGDVYVGIQHEDDTLKHDEGGPHFIERPVLQVAQDVPNALMAEIDRGR